MAPEPDAAPAPDQTSGNTPDQASELARQVYSALSEHGWTLATAESLTGGLVCSTLVGVPGVSAVLRGGVVAYATELKHRLLGVDADLLSANGPVDPDVAAQMALGVRDRLQADWGVSTTGVAGPGPQDGVPAGRAFVAVAGPFLSASVRPAVQEDPHGSAVPLGERVPAAQEHYLRTAKADLGILVTRLDLSGDRLQIRSSTVVAALRLVVAAASAGTARGVQNHDR